MLKIFVILRAIILLPIALPSALSVIIVAFGAMALAKRLAPAKPRRAAWLLLRLATFARRTLAVKPERTEKTVATFVMPALLLQGAPWPRVKRWCELANSANIAFEFYFAQRCFDDAGQAAQFWCEHTETLVAGRETEMEAFFIRYGDDLSTWARGEIMEQARAAELELWEANPQGKRPGFFELLKRATPRYLPFFRYYDSHLALGATRWIAKRHPNSRQTKREFACQSASPNSLGLARFQISDAALESLGMSATKLAAVRQQAMSK